MNKKFVVGAIALAVSVPVQGQEEGTTQTFGQFTLRTITDPMTDAKRGILVSKTDDIRMVIKCDENGPGSLYVSFISKNYLGALRYNNRDIKYRLDSAAPAAISAYHDKTTATIVDLKPASKGGQWLASTLRASKLTVQVSNYDYQTYAQVIDLDGFRAGVARTAAICLDANWYNAAT